MKVLQFEGLVIVITLQRIEAEKLYQILQEWDEYGGEYPVKDAKLGKEMSDCLHQILYANRSERTV